MFNSKAFAKFAAPIFCLALLTGSVRAQSPTSLAENSDQYNAYVYSYVSMVYSGNLADTLEDQGVIGDVAVLVADLCDAGFTHCYDALVDDDDSQWALAADDLDLALYWCDTLKTFASTSQPSSVINSINSLMWYLEIAIENAEDAVPPPVFLLPIFPIQKNFQR